jgi:hypothetical protein
MATTKLYTVCGVSTQNGETKARFANDTMRIKVLAKNGHTEISLVELPSEMTKIEAAKFTMTLSEFSSADAQSALAEYLAKHDRAPRVQVKAAVKKAVVKKPAKVSAELEAAPF